MDTFLIREAVNAFWFENSLVSLKETESNQIESTTAVGWHSGFILDVAVSQLRAQPT